MAEWNKKREVMHHYNDAANVYDAQYAEEQDEKIKAILNEISPQPNNIILDIGCGTGLLFKHLSNSKGLLVGLDTSLGILKRAKTRAKRHSNIVVIRAEADYTPFRNKTFNNIFAITLLQNMPNPKTTLREIKRISKHNATIAITALKKEFTKNAFNQIIEDAGLAMTILETDYTLKDYIATTEGEHKNRT
ncbi:MAG: methyltransferase domain-containing protein [Candidatus Bathyarchaeota archaeon]|nr:MAG: methyltransferase domain-containing protein [Candidatus Bathyarchaeota archaeon]